MPGRKRSVPGTYKWRIKLRVAGILVALFLVYLFIFLPPNAADFLVERLGTAVSVLSKLGFSFTFGYAFASILFGIDAAVNGTNKEAKFFRKWYPSKIAQVKYSCSGGDANELWFRYFNKWDDPNRDRDRHYSYITNFQRTYIYRLVFHAKQACIALGLLAAATLVVRYAMECKLPPNDELIVQGLIGVLLTVTYVVLRVSNRIIDENNATGVLAKCKEIMEIWRAKFDDDVILKSSTLQEARNTVDQL